MAHAQKPDFVFRRNGRVHLNLLGASVQSTTGRRAVHISLQGLYCSCKPVFCSHVTLTGYPLHSLVFPSLLLPCVTVCHHISNAVYSSIFLSAHSGNFWIPPPLYIPFLLFSAICNKSVNAIEDFKANANLPMKMPVFYVFPNE